MSGCREDSKIETVAGTTVWETEGDRRRELLLVCGRGIANTHTGFVDGGPLDCKPVINLFSSAMHSPGFGLARCFN